MKTLSLDRVDQVELDLIRAAQDIGRIADMNCHATASLTLFLERRGKVFREIQVGEVLALVAEWRAEREAMYRAAGL